MKKIYKNIKSELEKRIYEGNYENNAFFCRIDDVCSEFCVSKMTAYRALQELRDEGIVYTKQGNGIFIRNSDVLYEKHSRNNYVLMCGHHFLGASSSYFSFRNEAFFRYFQNMRMGVKFVSFKDCEELPPFWEYDGIKGVVLNIEAWKQCRKHLQKANLPVVVYDNYFNEPVSAVNWDKRKLVKKAVEYFRVQKVRTLTLVLPEWESELLKSYFSEYFDGKIMKIESVCLNPANSMKFGASIARNMVSQELPDAVFIADDVLFMGMLLSFQRARIEIPSELKVLVSSHPQSLFTCGLNVPVIGCEPERVGTAAAELLYRHIKGMESGDKVVFIPPELIISQKNKEQNIFSGVV